MSNKTTFVLVAPDIGIAGSLVQQAVEEALLSFFLGYSLPDEIYDDRWYYSFLRENFLDEDGLPQRYACDSEQEYWNYCRDPGTGLREKGEQIQGYLENIMEINDRSIDMLYDRRVFDRPFETIFYSNAIKLVFAG